MTHVYCYETVMAEASGRQCGTVRRGDAQDRQRHRVVAAAGDFGPSDSDAP